MTPALKSEASPPLLTLEPAGFSAIFGMSWESWVVVQLGVGSQGSGEHPEVSHCPPGTSSCLCLHLDLAPATPVWCQGTPWISSSFLLSFSVGPAADSCGGSRASPCWGGRQAQAGDSWGQRTSMAFRCLDGPPSLAGRVGAANVLTRLTGHCHSAASVPGLLTSGQGWPCIAEDCGELPGTQRHLVLSLFCLMWTGPSTC